MKKKDVDTVLEVVEHLEKEETYLKNKLNNKDKKRK